MSSGGAADSSARPYSSLPKFIKNSENDSATNAPQHLSQPDITPDCMTHSSKPPCAHNWEKNVYSGARDGYISEDLLKHSQPVHSETNDQTVIEEGRLFRSRTLGLSTLYHPAYHIEHPMPPPTTPAFSTLFQSSSKEQDDSPCTPLETYSSFQKIQDLRQALHLPRLLSELTFSFVDTPSFWLTVYFTLNLSLTLYNKSVLIHFPFPYTLTALHALCGTIGASILLSLQDTGQGGPLLNPTTPKPSRSLFQKITLDLSAGELVVLFFFSMLYTINIVVSNASLRLVTVPFHQVVRASTPFFTIVFSLVLLSKRCSRRKVLTLIPVVAGVCFATYGDYYFTPIGFFLTLLGTILAALKTILTNIILVKQPTSPLPISSDSSNHLSSDDLPIKSSPSFFSDLLSLPSFNSSSSILAANATKASIKNTTPSSFTLPKLSLSPLHLLYLLSPLAFIQTAFLAHSTGELNRVRVHLFHSSSSAHPEGGMLNFRMWLIFNGILAFFLNVVSFNANRRVGPLAMSVAANVKQVLTVLCAVFIFDLTITPANALGIFLTIAGGAFYAAVELHEKQNRGRWNR
ncbi:TPT-domain-containing protein [Phlegmacium glaucopus]|nr:TPT-domain-containing protein [Phlegmacium glaucopus]